MAILDKAKIAILDQHKSVYLMKTLCFKRSIKKQKEKSY